MNMSLGKAILSVATTVVVISVIAGVVIVGSPAEGRRQALDTERVEDLKAIVTAVDAFWERNERLPESLTELADEPRGPVNTLDPGSGQSYEYSTTGEGTYELCAAFDRPSRPLAGRTEIDFWNHGPGRHCFDVAVDTSPSR